LGFKVYNKNNFFVVLIFKIDTIELSFDWNNFSEKINAIKHIYTSMAFISLYFIMPFHWCSNYLL